MTTKKPTFFLLIAFIVFFSILYRVLPWRIPGFAPQIAIILLSGFYIKNKKTALLIPFLSLFISDAVYEFLYMMGWTPIYGFYGSGQIINYILLLSLILFSWYFKSPKLSTLAKSSLLAPTVYFFLSNSLVWVFGGGWGRPKNFAGYWMTLQDGIPFYFASLGSTLFFVTLFYFFVYVLVHKRISEKVKVS